MRIVRTDANLTLSGADDALRAQGHTLVLLPDGIPEDALVEAVRESELILMCYTPITARVIGAAPKLKGIVKYGVGIDAIDIGAAMARGIPVVNIPEYAENTVAEGAFALLLVGVVVAIALGRGGMLHRAWVAQPWEPTMGRLPALRRGHCNERNWGHGLRGLWRPVSMPQ